MIDKAQSTEKIVDELFNALGKELKKSQDAYLDALENDDTLDPPIFVESPRKKVNVKRQFRRMIILVAVLILGLVVISSEGVKEKMFNYFQTDKDGHTDLSYLEKEPEDGEMPKFELGHVPKGYTMIDEKSTPAKRSLAFGNDREEYIYFTVCKSNEYNASVDNDTLKRKEILINDNQGFLFYDESNSVIVWQIGDYTLDLVSYLAGEEAIKIAQNIQINK